MIMIVHCSLSNLEITNSLPRKKHLRFVYDIDHVYVLRIENTIESDPRSYEATKAPSLLTTDID